MPLFLAAHLRCERLPGDLGAHGLSGSGSVATRRHTSRAGGGTRLAGTHRGGVTPAAGSRRGHAGWPLPRPVVFYTGRGGDSSILAAALAVVVFVSLTRRRFRRAYRLLLAAQNLIGTFGVVLLAVILAQFWLRGQSSASPLQLQRRSLPLARRTSSSSCWMAIRGRTYSNEYGVWTTPSSSRVSRPWASMSRRELARITTPPPSRSRPCLACSCCRTKPWSEYAKPVDVPPADRALALQRSHGMDVLREHGYRLTSISGGFTHEDIRAVDEFITTGQADLIEITLSDGRYSETCCRLSIRSSQNTRWAIG